MTLSWTGRLLIAMLAVLPGFCLVPAAGPGKSHRARNS